MQPLTFRPILKRIRWGGRRLADVLGKAIGPETDYAESWELADHGDDQSHVLGGEFDGWTLERLVAERNRELLGRHAGLSQFPLLIKFLDAHDRLSVQVHPDDAQAQCCDPPDAGKTEAWVVIAAAPGSTLYAGLKRGVTADDLQSAAADGSFEQHLHAFEVKPGDCVHIPAGTVHAIAEGILLAEVQQSSDTTFRLHDWGRVGADGQPRPLHLHQALRCIDFDRGPVEPVMPQRQEHGGGATDELVACEFFVLRRHVLAAALLLPAEDRCRILMNVRGAGEILCGEATVPLPLGGTVLVPASAADVTLRPIGNAEVTVLDVCLP